ncbi:hypothetical protein BVX98_01425 [bacterium F11]|nr:hypothetical protein BVX98_01425 [bacterium F11]
MGILKFSKKNLPMLNKSNLTLSLWGTLVFGVAFGIYVFTSSPTLISCGDSAELAGVTETLGVAHAPGYPLFTLIGKIFSGIPVGKPALKTHLSTGFMAASAVTLLFLLLLLWRGNPLAAALAAWGTAFSYHFWLYALVPEISMLNVLFISFLVLLSALWAQSNPATPAWSRWPLLIAYILGLSFSHHHTIVLLLPGFGILWFHIMRQGHAPFSRHHWICISLFFLLGLTPYLYIPIRAQAMPYFNAGTVTTIDRFIGHLLRRSYGTISLTPEFSVFNWDATFSILGFYGSSLLKSFTWVGILLAMGGLVSIRKRQPWLFVFVILGFLLIGPAFLIYARMPATTNALQTVLERFMVPSFFIFSIAMGMGMISFFEKGQTLLKKRLPRLTSMFLMALLVSVFPLTLLVNNFPKLNLSQFRLCEIHGRDTFKSFKKNSIVIVKGDNSIFTLRYLQQVEGVRPDVKIISAEINKAYEERLRHAYPNLLYPERYPGQHFARDLILLNYPNTDIYELGIPGALFSAFGLAGNPFTLQPQGLAFKIGKTFDRSATDAGFWKSFDFPITRRRPWLSNSFVREVRNIYAISLYNNSILYGQHGLTDIAIDTLHLALRYDPAFEHAQNRLSRLEAARF